MNKYQELQRLITKHSQNLPPRQALDCAKREIQQSDMLAKAVAEKKEQKNREKQRPDWEKFLSNNS